MAGLIEGLRAKLFPGAELRRAFEAAEAGNLHDVFATLAKAARKGDARAEYWVGKAYLEGRGVPQSRTTATQWLHRAADAGQVDAQAVLAALYLTGASKAEGSTGGAAMFADVGVSEPDFDQAARWARSAAEAGSGDAQALLAYLMTSGPDAIRDLPAALEWYRKSAANGCAQGMLGLSLALLRDATNDDERAAAAAEMVKAAALDLAAWHLSPRHDDRSGSRRAAGLHSRGPAL